MIHSKDKHCHLAHVNPAPGGVRLDRSIHDLLDFEAIVKIGCRQIVVEDGIHKEARANQMVLKDRQRCSLSDPLEILLWNRHDLKSLFIMTRTAQGCLRFRVKYLPVEL